MGYKQDIASLSLALTFLTLLNCAPKPAPVVTEAKKAVEPAASPSEETGWEAEWEKILKGAKKERTVVVYGPAISEMRKAFIEEFQKDYPGIILEYTGMTGPQASAKIKAERRAGIYNQDIYIGGTTTVLLELRLFVIPIKPFLILPDVKDPKVWLEGRLDFSDEAEEINLTFAIKATPEVIYNFDLVQPSEISSWWDLTKTKWKGKVIMRDPRTAGGGQAVASFWYFEPKLGLDYIKAFAANSPVFTRELRFHAESVARGKYNIGIAVDTTSVYEFKNLGMPIRYTEILKEGTYITASNGTVAVMDKAPHPDAASVFLNWLLGKKGQTVYTISSSLASRRVDVPTDHLIEEHRPPKPGVSYSAEYKEGNIMKKGEMIPYLNNIFAGF